MKKFLFLKIFFLALYSPTIFAITCSTGSGGGGDSSSATYTWTEVTKDSSKKFTARSSHRTVVFDDKIWVIGGVDNNNDPLNDVWYSADGKTWTTATDNAEFAARAYHRVVVFDDDGKGEKMWLIGGDSGAVIYEDVYSSTNGATWTQETSNAGFGGRTYHTSVVFNNEIWMIAGVGSSGDANDVYTSTNGITWYDKTKNADFKARRHHTSVVFNDGSDKSDRKVWLIAGGAPFNQNDVWSTTNGVSWNEVKADSNDFSSDNLAGRVGHTSEVFDGKMWIIAGIDERPATGGDSNYKNSLFSSTNGKDWTEDTVDSSEKFVAREFHSSVVFKDKLWVIGGKTNGGTKNDVWFMERD